MLQRKATFAPVTAAVQHGPAYELYQLVRIGLPAMGAQLAQMGMGVADTVMVGRLASRDLAGIALGVNIMWPSMLLFWGMLIAITPIFAQLKGAGKIQAGGIIIHQAFWLAVVGAVCMVLIFMQAPAVLKAMLIEPEITSITSAYLSAIAWGVPGLLGYFVLRYMAEGMGYTKPAFVVALSALCLKIPLNYIFMYGKFGLPALGGAGCGVASAIVMWFECFAMLVVAHHPAIMVCRWRQKLMLPKIEPLKKILVLGFPIGMSGLLSMGVFSLSALLIGRLGADTTAAHQIAVSISAVVFMLPMAMGHAASIRIAMSVGGGAFDRARHITQVVLWGGPVMGLITGIILLVLRHPIAGLFTQEAAVAALAADLCIFVAIYQLPDMLQACGTGALRGYKITRFTLQANFVAYWLVALPISYYLAYGMGVDGYGVYGFWFGLSLAVFCVAVLITIKLWLISRQSKQVVR